jgi:peptide chain release factor 2
MKKDQIQQEINHLEAHMMKPDFWNDKEQAQQVIADIARLKEELLGDQRYGKGSALINIFAGAGGDDAEDFVRILFEMYQGFTVKNSYTLSILSSSPNELNGYRSISFEVAGKGAYGKLKGESGVHRLVRKSPFNSKGKRQTSFVLVEVLPDIQEKDFVLDESELEVRIVHPKTGFSVFISEERTQERNKERALQIMRAKLHKKHQEDEEKRMKGLSISDKVNIEWGSQMRSYVFDPYQIVKDHDKGIETKNIDAVLGGDLDIFIS